jgi:lipoprotein-anchoring transpeptidase ErfK/SrfK
MMRAALDEQAGNVPAAAEHLRRAAEDFPTSPDRPSAQLNYARLLQSQGKVNEAFAIYDNVSKTAPPALRAPALLALAGQREQAGDIDGAYQVYRQVMNDTDLHSDDWFEAASRYGAINVRRIFSRDLTPESKTYRVQPGDSIYAIGMKLNTTQALLTRANELGDGSNLHVNMTLKYTPKEFEIVIERSTLRLYLLDKDGIFNVYRVGLGKPTNQTALGRFRIGNKVKDPTWYKPGYGPIAPGSPENELGTRWLPMIPEVQGLPADLGIHGTVKPETIGHYASMGCPRLYNEQVEELYDLVVRSTPVSVVDVWDGDTTGGRAG